MIPEVFKQLKQQWDCEKKTWSASCGQVTPKCGKCPFVAEMTARLFSQGVGTTLHRKGRKLGKYSKVFVQNGLLFHFSIFLWLPSSTSALAQMFGFYRNSRGFLRRLANNFAELRHGRKQRLKLIKKAKSFFLLQFSNKFVLNTWKLLVMQLDGSTKI